MQEESDTLLLHLLFQLVLILVNAFFSASEIALISFNRTRAEKRAAQGNKKAKTLLRLKQNPEKFLAAIQIGITLAGFLASAFAANNFADSLAAFFASFDTGIRLSSLRTASVVLITIVLSLCTIVLGELVPKRVAMKKVDSLAYLIAPAISFMAKICAPLIWLLSSCTNLILRAFRIDPKSEEDKITEDGIRLMVDAGSEKGAIEESEKEFINNVFEFDDKNAGDLMTHRLDTAILWLRDDDKCWEKTIIEKRHDHYPVCGETVDDIEGVLSARDYILLDRHDRKTVLANAVHTAQFLPESLKANVLFAKMKQSRNHFSLVLDEYGGFSGIVTMNDILASIVGEF
jgi:putative hemolysin